jgi:hypothetical protein
MARANWRGVVPAPAAPRKRLDVLDADDRLAA